MHVKGLKSSRLRRTMVIIFLTDIARYKGGAETDDD